MSDSKKWLTVSFAGLSIWIIGFVSLPLLGETMPGSAEFLQGIYGRTCHQLPGRSLTINGLPLGVCTRCTALYAAGWLVLFAGLFRKNIRLLPGIIYVLLSLPMLTDFFLEKAGVYHDMAPVRLITGFLFGIALFHLFAVSLQPDMAYIARKKG